MFQALRDRLQADIFYYDRMMHQAVNEGRKDDECHHAGRKKEAESLLEFVGETEWAPTELSGLAELASVMVGGHNSGLTSWIYKYGPGDRCPTCGRARELRSTKPCDNCGWKRPV